MDTTDICSLFFELVKIDSPSGNEEAVRNFIIKCMEGLADSFEIDQAGNIKFTVNGTIPGPLRLFSAHMDTVEPGRGIEPIIGEDGVIRSKGETVLGADDKDGITAIICALRRLKAENADHVPLEILFTAGEEKSLSGSSRITGDFLKAKQAWVLDGPGNTGTIYRNGVGKSGFTIRVKGKAAHAGLAPEKGINAFMLAAEGMIQFPPGRRENATVNYGRISGGKADNIVPDEVILTGEIRSHSKERIADLVQELEQVWSKYGEIEYGLGYPAFEENDQNFLKWTGDIIAQAGLTPSVQNFSAGSDANHLARLGLDVCLLAMGRKDNHSKSESTRPEFIKIMSDAAFMLMSAK